MRDVVEWRIVSRPWSNLTVVTEEAVLGDWFAYATRSESGDCSVFAARISSPEIAFSSGTAERRFRTLEIAKAHAEKYLRKRAGK